MPLALAVCALLTLAASPATAQEINLRLRIAWGGGESRQWDGVFRLSAGEFSELVPLGLEPDEPGSIYLENGEVHVNSRGRQAYDGFDVVATAPRDAKLSIALNAPDGRAAEFRDEIPLAELVTDFRNVALDERGNRLLARRAPGDELRVTFERDSLVFAPGDTFKFRAEPYLTGIAPGTSVTCRLSLTRSDNNEEVWNADKEIRIDDDGSFHDLAPQAIELPRQEGVYDLLATLTPWRIPAPFVKAKPVVQRKVQLVVIDSQPPRPADDDKWREEVELDPANPGWWDRIKQLPQMKIIPGLGQGPLGNQKSRPRPYENQTLIELDPDGWQAYPLPIGDAGRPHILEVEYPAGQPQTLGISILEPNAAGDVAPLGLDSGVDVQESPDLKETGLAKHRLIFWPRTNSPLVLLVNRRDNAPAVFGKLRVLVGPATLPSAPVSRAVVDGRLLAAYFDKPLFPENFSAPEALDTATRRSLDDWNTFYQGGRRLVEYLKHLGYNGAVISVVSEGSAIYPSGRLAPTPKYDSGVFFLTGQDPVRKDVLEMLFLLFDREGLTLIPAVQFASPLPALEQLKRRGAEETEGLELLDGQGRPWVDANGSRHGLAAYYNPLDDRVRQAMLDVVGEIAIRYGHHTSFGGLSLQLGPDTYAQLPDEVCGYDDRTVGRFARETKLTVPATGSEGYANRERFLRGEGREAWIAWRAARLAGLYDEMIAEIDRSRRGARLYLAGAELTTSLPIQNALRPALPSRAKADEALVALGLSLPMMKREARLVFPRPIRVTSLASEVGRASNANLRDAVELDRRFGERPTPSALHFHVTAPLRLRSFEEVSPFGPQRTNCWLAPHVSPSGARNRRRFVHSVATLDAQSIFDGGWMLPLGQEDALRELFDVYRRLPAERFETAVSRQSDTTTQPVVVRTLRRGGMTYIYLVNDSPWPVSVEVDLEVPATCRLTALGTRGVGILKAQTFGATWTARLEPYDLVGATLSAPNALVIDWRSTLPADVPDSLRRRVKLVLARADALSEPPPVDMLVNPGFEQPPVRNRLVGWVHARGDDILVETNETYSHAGRRSLRVTSTKNVAWVRSDPFPPPQTGRVSVLVWLRIDDTQRQPPLRLAIEGRLNGDVYYRFATVGAGSVRAPLQDTWELYLFHVDDLPLSGLTELRVGFDLMGPGEVWIDDVQVHNVWFNKNERDELVKNIAVASFQLDKGKMLDCERFLDSYWPRFLALFVDVAPRTAAVPRDSRPDPPAAPDPKSPSVFDRMKGALPKRIFPF